MWWNETGRGHESAQSQLRRWIGNSDAALRPLPTQSSTPMKLKAGGMTDQPAVLVSLVR